MDFTAKAFAALVKRVFSPPLLPFGFALVRRSRRDEFFCARVFRADERYIEVSANCNWRDGEPHCNVVLGIGDTEWPERDWNAIPLWQLHGERKEYLFDSADELEALALQMRDDLLRAGADFLSGDITRFDARRAEWNRDREPYCIYQPQADGSYRTIIDPISRRLKERFS